MSIDKELSRIKEQFKLKEKISRLAKLYLDREPTKDEINWLYWDYIKFYIKYKGDIETDYFGTQMYRKSDFVRKESLANRSRFEWRYRLFDSKKYIFDNKIDFYRVFARYLKRRWFIFDDRVTFEKLCDFVEMCDRKVFVKAPESFGGKDCSCYYFLNKEDMRIFYKENKGKNLIIEEIIRQDNDFKKFSEVSVNTLRIITLIDKFGYIHIAKAFFRMGIGHSFVDNFSSGGISAEVDVDTGIIKYPAYNKLGREYIFHPDTNKQIVGYKFDDWNKCKEFVEELAQVCPGMRYIGWDVSKNEKGDFCVIEGNAEAGVDLMESRSLYGLKPVFDRIILGNN